MWPSVTERIVSEDMQQVIRAAVGLCRIVFGEVVSTKRKRLNKDMNSR